MLEGNSSPEDTYWRAYDAPLCQLVDRLECEHQLEVEFRLIGEGTEGMIIADSLAQFREKGRIRVVRVGLDGKESVVHPFSGE